MAKETVGYLPGSDPEAIKQNLNYQAALERMEQALMARQNRMFDPQMLALASGFLAPTQTGGFGESLGMAAKNVREAQMQEEKEEREIAQAQLGLAGKGIQLERQRMRDRAFQSMLGGPQGAQPSGALPGGTQLSTRPGGALPGKPVGFENVQGIQIAPPNPIFGGGQQYINLARLDETISPAQAQKEAQKLEQDRFQVRENGVQDLATGMFYPFPKGETVKRQIFGKEGTYDVDTRTAALLDMYAANGDPRYHELAERITQGPKIPPKAGEEPKDTTRKTSEEREAEAAGMKETATERAKAREKERQNTLEAGSDAVARIGTYNALEKIASGPQAELLFGIFNRPNVLAQIGILIESGIGTPGFTIGIPQIRTAMRNIKLEPELIEQGDFAISLMANIQLQISRLAQGQGAVSDYERSLFGLAGITEKDNPKTILAKLDLLRARAEFDREVAKAVRQYKGNIDDFKSGDDYMGMVERYQNKLGNIYENRFGKKPDIKPSGGRDNRGAASRLPI